MVRYLLYFGLVVTSGLMVTGCRLELSDKEDDITVNSSTDYANGTFQAEVVLLDNFGQPAELFNSNEVITLEYRLTNLTSRDVKITYSSGQRISSVVIENDEVRLNIDALFVYTQAIADDVIAANSTRTYTLNFDADLLGAGSYQLIAAASLRDIHPEFLISNDNNQFVASVNFSVQD